MTALPVRISRAHVLECLSPVQPCCLWERTGWLGCPRRRVGTASFFPFSLTHPHSGLGDASLHVTRQQGGSADVIPPPSLRPSQPPYCKAGKCPVFRPSLRSLSQQQRQTRSGTRSCFFTHCYYLLGCGLRHQSIIKTRKNTHGSWGSLRIA